MSVSILDRIEQGDLGLAAVTDLFEQIVSQQLSDVQIAAVLTAFKFRGISEQEIAGAAQALRHYARAVPGITDIASADCCGTGGDGLQTINISTLSALVCAAAGVPMVKHGNRSVSSTCGSADLLEALGVTIDIKPDMAAHALKNSDFCFLFAPSFHPAIAKVMPVRNQLKTRTLFNLLGPLLNPAKPRFQLVGVYDVNMLVAVAKSLSHLQVQRALVVNANGMDEISIAGPTDVAELNNGQVTSYQITPEQLGITRYDLSDIQVMDKSEAVERSLALLKGHGKSADVAAVAVNSAAVLYCTGVSQSLAEGVELAQQLILQGAGFAKLNQYKQCLVDYAKAQQLVEDVQNA